MYYIIGDIHGCNDKFINLFNKIKNVIKDDDIIILLGDYIDRGPSSYEVIESLLLLSRNYHTIFLKGNHEDMFLDYINGEDASGSYLYNGGDATVKSYRSKEKKDRGDFWVPDPHVEFLCGLNSYFEAEDFMAVHAGLNPDVENIKQQNDYDLYWIRDIFYRSDKRWPKTIIFGHTPTYYINGKWRDVYWDDTRNIIGIDTGAVYGGALTCLIWPRRVILQS